MKTPSDVVTSSPGAEKTSHRKRLIFIATAIVAIVALALVVRALVYGSTHETTDDAQVAGDLVIVTSKIAERVREIDVSTNNFVHRGQVLVQLEDRDERRRYAQAVASLNAIQAQSDAASANLSLTTDQQRAQVQQGDAGVVQAQAGITGAQDQVAQAQDEAHVTQASVATAQAQVTSSRALVTAAQASLKRADADLVRSTRLVRTGDAPASELDAARATEANVRASKLQADSNVLVAQSALNGAIARANAQRSAIAAARSAVAIQQAQLTTAQAKLLETSSPFRLQTQRSTQGALQAQVASQSQAQAIARDQQNDTLIRSTIDGYVGEKDVAVGKTVAPGETLLTLVPSRGLYVTANFKETQIGRIHPGQAVELTIDAYPNHVVRGHVETMPPASQATYSLIPQQNSTGNFVKVAQRMPVRIAVDGGVDAEHPLRVGMSVEVAVQVK